MNIFAIALLSLITLSSNLCMLSQQEKDTELLAAVVYNNLQKVTALLNAGANSHTKSITLEPLIVIAMRTDIDSEIVHQLLLHGAANDVNASGDTALHEIISYCDLTPDKKEKIGLLLSLGANIEAQNKRGETSLHTAARYDNPHLVTALLQRGAFLNYCDKKMHTALSTAIEFGNVRINLRNTFK